MVLISFTNCVVDEFNYGKDSADKYLYFLNNFYLIIKKIEFFVKKWLE